MRRAALAGVLLFAGNVAVSPDLLARQNPAQAPAPATSLSGQVVDGTTGRGLRGARVVLTGPRNVRHATTTNAAGAFLFGNLPPGRYRIAASRRGFVSASVVSGCGPEPGRTLELDENRSCSTARIVLTRGGVLTGWVVDEFNDSVVEASVRAYRAEYSGGMRRLASAGSTRTDDRGHFRIAGLQPGTYYLAATVSVLDESANLEPGQDTARNAGGSGFALTFHPGTLSPSNAVPVRVRAGQESPQIQISLIPARLVRIEGRVSAPAPWNYTVLFSSARPDGVLLEVGGFFNVDANGGFVIPSVPPGDYRLDVISRAAIEAVSSTASSAAARRTRSHFVSVPVTVIGEDIRDLVLTPGPGFTVTGRIVAEGQQELPEALREVSIQALPAIGAFGVSVQLLNAVAPAAADGTFELDRLAGPRLFRVLRLPSGWTVKSISAGAADITDQGLDVSQDIHDLLITLTSRLSPLSGTVTGPNDAPPAEASVVVFPRDRSKWSLMMNRHVTSATVDPEGRFNIPHLPPGDYLVLALPALEPGEWAEPHRLASYIPIATGITVKEGEASTLHLRLTDQR